jgi:predicted RNA-binding protein associated with RNAse of E/G family
MAPDHPEGVEVPRSEGDYALTQVEPGALTLVTDYYSKEGTLKGTYVNINTGIEIYPSNGSNPGRIRYVDLEIDVVAPKQGETRIIDQHLLKRAVQRGFITQEMADQARAKAKSVYAELLNFQNL